MDGNERAVLVFMLGALGDTLVSLAALRAIRAEVGPHTKVIMLHDDHGQGWTNPSDILETEGVVDEYVTYRAWRGLRGLWSRWGIVKQLRARHVQRVYSLVPSERSKAALARDRFFFVVCAIRQGRGFKAPWSSGPDDRRQEDLRGNRPAEAWIRLWRVTSETSGDPPSVSQWPAPWYSLRLSAQEREVAIRWLEERGVARGDVVVGVAPGAKRQSTRWPIERFAAVVAALGKLPRVRIVVFGGHGEESLAAKLLETDPFAIDCVGRLSVRSAGGVLDRCALFIGNDSGTTHLAAAVNTRCLTISSAREPRGQWAPLGKGHTVLRERVPCELCRLDECNVRGHPCLSGISVSLVLERAMEMLRMA